MLRYRLLLVPMLAALLIGCGSSGSDHESAKVVGQVQFRGRPVQTGFVIFKSKDGKYQAEGRIEENGTYTVEKAPLGDVKVCLQLPEVPPELLLPPGKRPKFPKGAEPEGEAKQKKLLTSIVGIPQRYTSPDNSGLSTTVKKGVENKYNVVLR